MPWIAFTESHLLRSLTTTELTAFRNASKQVSEADQVSLIINDVAAYVRGFCARKNSLENGDTMVPQSLITGMADICAMRIMARAGGLILDTHGARKAASEQAERTLEAVANGTFPIPRAIDADSEKIGAFGPQGTYYKRSQFTTASQNGL